MQLLSGQNVGIAYVYCTYKRISEQTPIALLTSLLSQLIHSQLITDQTNDPYEAYLYKNTRPKLEDIVSLIEYEVRQYSKVFLIIDALDELDDGSKCELLMSNVRVIQSKSPLKVMTTSREMPKICFNFKDSLQLPIRANYRDVMACTHDRLSHLPKCVTRNADLQHEIGERVSQNVDGM